MIDPSSASAFVSTPTDLEESSVLMQNFPVE